MLEWLDSVAGAGYARAVLWTLAALVLLVIVLIIVKLVRSMTFGTFVSGGRNRKTRLAVMDATAIDSHRRLVLIRRDDIEHLLLIGGPTDVVVERDIRLSPPRRPALTGEGGPQEPSQRQRPPQPAPAPARPAPPRAANTAPPVSRSYEPPAPSPGPASQRPTPATVTHLPSYTHSQPAGARQTPQTAGRDAVDDALMRELEMSLDPPSSHRAVAKTPSPDEDMTRLLGELSVNKK